MARARALSIGEWWIGLGAGLSQSRGETQSTRDINLVAEDPSWITGEVFFEQPVFEIGVMRLSVGGKHMWRYETCSGASGCASLANTLYADLGIGLVL